jgi:hypothetical protein
LFNTHTQEEFNVGLFFNKDGISHKEAKKIRQLQAKRYKEMKAKASVNRTLYDLKNQSKKLSDFKLLYIEKAREALKVNNQESYQLAKSGIKLSLTKQKFLDSMISNFEIAMQLNDMNEVIKSFVNGINIISTQLKRITSSVDLIKAQEAFESAVYNNTNQYEALNNFVSVASEGLKNVDFSTQPISDEEIDQLITNQTINSESQLDKEIQSKINQIKDKMETR